MLNGSNHPSLLPSSPSLPSWHPFWLPEWQSWQLWLSGAYRFGLVASWWFVAWLLLNDAMTPAGVG